MTMLKGLLVIVLLGLGRSLFAQDEMYRGGARDGFARVDLAQTTIGVTLAQGAYLGGPQDGHAHQSLQNFTPGVLNQFGAFRGGAGDGYSADSLNVFSGVVLNHVRPYLGGSGDGYDRDSLIAFQPGRVNHYLPYVGGVADGYDHDSLVSFQPGIVNQYLPYFGGSHDGHAERVLCNYPLYVPDTTLFIPCINNTLNLTQIFGTIGLQTIWNTPNPTAAPPGNYTLIAAAPGGCRDTLSASIVLDVATWTGSVSNNWHTAGNWSTNRVPGTFTHVIVSTTTPNPCVISAQDAEAASVQVRSTGDIRVENGRRLLINGLCSSLPSN